MALPPAQTEAEAPLPPEQHPGDLSSLSDDELKQQYAKAQNPLAGMSDEDLTRAYHQANPTGSQGIPLTGYLSQPAQPISSDYDPYIKQSAMGRILNAFGQGAAQGWGSGDAVSDDVADVMRKAGIFNDVQEGHSTIAKSFNEAFLRPPIAILSHLYGAAAAGIEGTLEAANAASQELPNASPVTGEGYLRESLASLLNPRQAGEAATQFAEQRLTTGVTNEFGLPTLPNLTVAQAMKVIPGGDSEYFGLTNAAHSPIDGAAATAKAAQDAAKEQTGTPYQYEPGALGAQPTEGGIGTYTPQSIDVYAHQHPEDIHAAARNVDPQTFQKYDALNIHADDLRDRISQASEENRTAAAAQAPHAAEIEDLNNKLASEPTPRLAKKYTARIAELQPEHDAFLESDQHAMLTRDTDQVSDMRQELQKLDYQMRDLAPQVTAAYREAGRQFPELTAEAAEPATLRSTPETATGEAGRPVVTPPNEGVKPPSATPTTAAQPENAPPSIIPANAIMQDVSSKLQAAGRPAEEADAAAAVVQARYEARAQAFGGAKGSAHELYEREGPAIQGAEKGRMGVNGQTSIKDGQTIVTLFKRADASTFLHEMGHHWLEEINGDAKDDAATPQMKSDWEAVRNYLKQPDDGIITRRAHEKFARGFERYMMEGVAPTRALDGVFAKFKDWLTTIYQSVNKLRSPITADIRDVFDRMLGKGTEPATITPEPPEPRTVHTPPTQASGLTRDLASLHETDAATTPPHLAAEAADQIQAEREETIAKQVPDVRPTDESNTGAGTETGGGEQRGGAAGEPGGTTGGGSGNAAESAAERGRGVNPAEKGITALESAEPADKPTYAAQRYARPDTRLVDKAGNIRLDNLVQPEDVKQAIREAAAENNGFMDARRGVMSDQELLNLSEALGMDAYTLNARALGKAFNAEETVAAYNLLINSATAVRDAAIQASESMSDADVLSYGEAKERHKLIQSQVSGITAEAGRALRAHRMAKEMLTNQGLADINHLVESTDSKTLFQLRAELKYSAGQPTSAQLSKFIADSAYKPTFTDMLLEYFVNSLISGPATHTTYMVGNAMLALWRAVPETAIQAAISSIRQAPAGERVYWGEIGAQLHGMMYGSRNGVVAGWAALKSGQTEPLPHEEFDAMSPGQVTKYDTARAQGMTHDDAIKATLGINYHTPVQFALGGKGAAIPDFNVAGVPLPLGSVIRAPSRVVGGIHSFFRAMGYSQEISRLSYRMASDEGLIGDAFTRRVADLTTNPPEDMMAAARAVATEQTLMGRGGPLTQAIAHLTDVVPPLKFVMPFVKIGSNIMSQGFVERTPIGALYPEIRANLMGRNGALVRDQQISRMIAGTGLAGAFTGFAAEGMATGAAPDDPKEAAVWRLAGNQEYSARIGDTWFGLHRFGPIGLLSGFGADLYQYGHELSVGDADRVGMTIVGGFARGILDETWLRGPSELIQAMTNPTEYGQKFIDDEVTSFMPFSIGMAQMARGTDPYQHQARGILQTAQNKTPFWSRSLLPEYDIFGQPMRSRAVFGMAGLSAIYETQLNNDPVPKAMLRLGVFPGQVKRSIDGIQLTDQQYAEYAQQAGTRAKMILDMKLGTPGYTDLPEGIQAKDIRDTFTKSRLWAEALVKAQNPDIMIRAMQQKHDIAVNGSGKGEK